MVRSTTLYGRQVDGGSQSLSASLDDAGKLTLVELDLGGRLAQLGLEQYEWTVDVTAADVPKLVALLTGDRIAIREVSQGRGEAHPRPPTSRQRKPREILDLLKALYADGTFDSLAALVKGMDSAGIAHGHFVWTN